MHYRAFGNTFELDRVRASSVERIEDLIFEGTSLVNARAHTFTRERLASVSHSTFKLLVSGTVAVMESMLVCVLCLPLPSYIFLISMKSFLLLVIYLATYCFITTCTMTGVHCMLQIIYNKFLLMPRIHSHMTDHMTGHVTSHMTSSFTLGH